ncbi:GTP-binding protein [Staphylococcus saccharolyticus]|uniref:Cobalamin synthesis related protein CobW n=1 Tax=Staphylococcus saccharolyticus TaxID=33028 RepID=A0A380GXB9_9STAP|nr:GTP-binding protein [Staphylococcus saccharolyticus]MBL7571209.1 GTP-binding protein [Staphylococcus saccharolyticus]QQB99048.1 GTP-binding protein [Staphylococcus saccharolyticus]QRJ66738.1 GTP-binding protein [Staphylococcus saccharolyticus]RTX99693.1 hypothetical protein CD145_00995 [Staphylococcus saccharolyticus]
MTPVLAPITTIRSIIGLIVAQMYQHIDSYPQDIQTLFFEQLSHCSTLFINKMDLTNVEDTARLLSKLERINGDANIQVGQYGELSLKSLLEVKNIVTKNRGTLHGRIEHRFIDMPKLETKESFIDTLDQLPQNVYRVKRFVHFTNAEHIYLVQYTQGEIELSPIYMNSDVPLYLIVIGKDLTHIELKL